MAASTCRIEIEIRVAWWVRPYLFGVATIARMTGLEPDLEKVQRTMLRGIKPVVLK